MEFRNKFFHFFEYELLNNAVWVAFIVLVAFILLKVLKAILNRFINRASEDLKVDPTQYKFLKNGLGFVIYISATVIIFMSFDSLRDIGLTLFAGAGIFAAIAGFASQAAFSNIVSGLFIVFFKPFRVGDIVKISNLYAGTIEDITLRHTVIKDFENKRLIIPNSVISSETIHNFNIIDEKVCNHVFYGISYDSDIDKAIDIIRSEAMAHPNYRDCRTKEEINEGIEPVIIRLINFGDSSVNLRAQVWSDDPATGFVLKCDINKSIKERFDREGIEIPFPHRTIVYKEEKKES